MAASRCSTSGWPRRSREHLERVPSIRRPSRVPRHLPPGPAIPRHRALHVVRSRSRGRRGRSPDGYLGARAPCSTRCLAGRRAFEGPTLTDTLAQILTSDPDWSKLPSATPPALSALTAAACARICACGCSRRGCSTGAGRSRQQRQHPRRADPALRGAAVFTGAAVVFAASLALFSGPPQRRGAPPPANSGSCRRGGFLRAPRRFEDGNSLAMSRDGRTMAWVGEPAAHAGSGCGRSTSLTRKHSPARKRRRVRFSPQTVSGSVFLHRLR